MKYTFGANIYGGFKDKSKKPFWNIELINSDEYQFTLNGVPIGGGFTDYGHYVVYLGKKCSLQEAFRSYLKYELHKEIKGIQDKIKDRKFENVSLRNLKAYHSIYLLLGLLIEESNKMRIKELYTERPNNKCKHKYVLKASHVQKILIYLGIIKVKGNFLSITEKGKNIQKKSRMLENSIR